jgi:hypothetical protein
MNADMMKKMLFSLIADAAAAPAKGKAKGKKKGNPEALRKWRESQKGKKAAPAKAKAKPKVVEAEETEGVECGGVEFRKGTTTKQGREYVLIYVNGAYAGSLRVDDSNLLKAAVKGLKHADAVDAIELACE